MKNLLVDEAGELKLTYMCNVNELYDLYTNKLNINLAPEIYSYHVVTDAADWWSFGAILYELLVGMVNGKIVQISYNRTKNIFLAFK